MSTLQPLARVARVNMMSKQTQCTVCLALGDRGYIVNVMSKLIVDTHIYQVGYTSAFTLTSIVVKLE